jgi:hypothetical protein
MMNSTDIGKIQSKNVKRFTLEGTKTKAKVISIQSGNLFDVVFHVGGDKVLRFTCRLLDCDAPSMEERPKAAKLAREYLAHICMGDDPKEFDDKVPLHNNNLQWLLDDSNHLVYAKFEKFDPFGIPLVTLKTSVRGKSINNMMKAYVQELNNMSESSDVSVPTSED